MSFLEGNAMQKIKNVIKNSPFLGALYSGMLGICIFFLRHMIRVNDKQIMFASYSGRQISDTPLAAYQILKADPEFEDYHFVWAVNQPGNFPEFEDVEQVKMDSIGYFIQLLKSKYWISNASIERLIPFKHPNNIYIQFWHGVPLKTLGHSEPDLPHLVQRWYDHVELDYLFAYSSYDAEKLHGLFPQTKQVVERGQLRKWLSDQVQPDLALKAQLGNDKPVLLYVPTYRNDQQIEAFLNTDELTDLMHDYQVIYRGHYFSERTDLPGLIDGNQFDLYQLFAVADLLITDYSSVMFDFAYWQKPIYLYAPDLENYQATRGFFLNPKSLGLPVVESFDDLKTTLTAAEPMTDVLQALEMTYDPHDVDQTIEAFKACFK